ncbi:MAG: FAD-dependent oxidoreductase, partial [Bacteroidetes bacterium SW_11_45_7]
MNQYSYWEQDIYRQQYDVIIIGAGLTGLNTSLALKEHAGSLHIAIVDKDVFPSGASTRNAGFACFGSPTELNADFQRMGEDEVWHLVEKRYKGLRKLLSKVDPTRVDYYQTGGYEVFFDEDASLYQSALANLDHYNHKLKAITEQEHTFYIADRKIADFGFEGVKGMIGNPLEAQLHPGKLVAALREQAEEKGVDFITGLEVTAIDHHNDQIRVVCHDGTGIASRSVVVANNGYAQRLLPGIDLSPGRGQVIVTLPIQDLPFRGSFHYNDGFYYFRNVGNRVLLGGGRNLSMAEETTTEKGLTTIIQNKLEEHLQHYFLPHRPYSIEFRWSGIMGFGSGKTPLIEEVQPGVFTAVRLGGMGVALSAQVGDETAG